MNAKISKTNQSLALLNARLDEIQMPSHERLRAKARLAQTEAFADAAVKIVNIFNRLLKTLVLRPYHRITHSTG